jgi:hypothetical protein
MWDQMKTTWVPSVISNINLVLLAIKEIQTKKKFKNEVREKY